MIQFMKNLAITGGLLVVLGSVQAITATGTAIELPSASQRRLLALLALRAPNACSNDAIVGWMCSGSSSASSIASCVFRPEPVM